MRFWLARVVAASTFLSFPAFAADSVPALEVVKLKPDTGEKSVSSVDKEVDQTLARIADKETDEISDKADFDRLLELDAAAIPRLSKVLADGNARYDHRWVCARALGRIGGPKATEALRGTLEKDKFSMMRLAAIHGLKDINDAGSFDAMVKALKDEAMVVRSAAADALGALGDPRAVKPLVDALDREDNFYRGRSLWVRRHIVDALGKIESRAAVAVFIDKLDDADTGVALSAINGLERVTKVSFRVPAANQEEWRVRTAPKWKSWWAENKKDYL